MSLIYLIHVYLYAKSGLLGNLYAAILDLKGLLGKPFKALLSDPVGIKSIIESGNCCSYMGHHGQGYIKVVI